MKSKILIIDDDDAVLDILNEWFSEEGFIVKALSETNNLLDLIKKFKPNLVLLDYQLKDVNGGRLCQQIKSNNKYNKIPVVIFSAFPESLLLPSLYQCDLFVEKPFDLYLLTQQFNTLISASNVVELNIWLN
ncbi:DNA-binding response OmpR family regulator [Pedobacter sp. CG_S7]|uniref:response regulator n=1 Tax=Pedobacter sp. CG_S7 TaxID=3143930 RepID=UPI0033942A43